MGDVILVVAVAAAMVFGFFIMKRLDVFLEENRKVIREQEGKRDPLEFLEAGNYEKMISEIENFKKSHKKAAIIIFDGENRELTDALNEYKSRIG